MTKKIDRKSRGRIASGQTRAATPRARERDREREREREREPDRAALHSHAGISPANEASSRLHRKCRGWTSGPAPTPGDRPIGAPCRSACTRESRPALHSTCTVHVHAHARHSHTRELSRARSPPTRRMQRRQVLQAVPLRAKPQLASSRDATRSFRHFAS